MEIYTLSKTLHRADLTVYVWKRYLSWDSILQMHPEMSRTGMWDRNSEALATCVIITEALYRKNLN